jgi:hypothetical protein
MVQRGRACDSFAIGHSDNEKFSSLRSAAAKKCTRHPVPVLSVRSLRDRGILLQFCNVGILNAFWPFFTGIVIQLLAAMSQFARIILVPPE